MKYHVCPKCSNADNTYSVLQCRSCGGVIGCFKEFTNPIWGKQVSNGCANLLLKYAGSIECKLCGHKGTFFNPETMHYRPIIG